MKKILTLALLILMGCASNKPVITQTIGTDAAKCDNDKMVDPVALLKQNDLELQNELQKKSYSLNDIERIKYLSSGLFDFPKMAERSLPQSLQFLACLGFGYRWSFHQPQLQRPIQHYLRNKIFWKID